MRLEVGKKYLTREGEVAIINKNDNTRIYPFEGDVGTLKDICWTADGRYLLLSNNNPMDLVREVVITPQVEVTSVKQLFEVGKTYHLANGYEATIFAYHPDQSCCYIGEYKSKVTGYTPSRWKENGSYPGRDKQFNLVLPEPEIIISSHVYTTWLDAYAKNGNGYDSKGAIKAAIKAYLAEQKALAEGVL